MHFHPMTYLLSDREFVPPDLLTLLCPSPQPLQTLGRSVCFLCLGICFCFVCLIWILHISEVPWQSSFCDCLTSLSMVPLGSVCHFFLPILMHEIPPHRYSTICQVLHGGQFASPQSVRGCVKVASSLALVSGMLQISLGR